jgi:hypothetical protein
MDGKSLARFAAAAVAALALAGCGGDDERGGDGAQTAEEQLETVATPEQERALREEAQRVEDLVEDAISDLRDVRSLDDVEEQAEDATEQLEEARARVEALDLAEEQEAARAQLVEAIETLEREVRELQTAIADQDPVEALRGASDISLDELQAAVARIQREARE